MEKEKKVHPMLDQMEAYKCAEKAINKLYETETGKKFIHHLIYSFNVEKPKPLLFCKGDRFDCLSLSKLRPVHTKDDPAPQDLIELYTNYKSIKDEKVKEQLSEEMTTAIKAYIHSKGIPRVIYYSSKTNKVLGIDEYQALMDFVDKEVKSGNVQIINIMFYLDPKKYKQYKKKFGRQESKEDQDGDLLKLKLKQLVEKYS